VNSVTRGTQGAEQLMRMSVTFSVPALLELFFTVGMIHLTMGLEVSTCFMSMMGMYVYYTVNTSAKRISYIKLNNDRSDIKFKTFLESLDNFDLIKYFTLEEKEAKR